jgi:predicted porin
MGFATVARAGDLIDDVKSLKDKVPEVTIPGVVVYGTIDVGYAFQTNGAPLSGNQPQGLLYGMFGSRQANGEISSIADNALEQSKIGVRIETKLGYDWVALGKIETGFNPISGELSDGIGSLARNNTIPLVRNWASSADSSRAGQAFNGPVYGGVSHPTYGTLTVGRQQSLMLDTMAVYDPQNLAYAFSFLGWSGFGPGGGDTEAARWDNSAKYVFTYGPFHAAGMFANGSEDTGFFNSAYGADAGFTYRGFSIDALYTNEGSVVSGSTLATVLPPFSPCSVLVTGPAAGFDCAKSIAGTISDNSVWSVQAKYTFEFEEGSLKDPTPTPAAKLTIYGGYENVIQGNPADIVNIGERTQGGYVLATVNNTNFFTNRLSQIAWTGFRYELPSGWTFSAGYYLLDQNSFRTGVTGNTCQQQTAVNQRNKIIGTFQGNPIAANCSGDYNSASFLVDYQFNKYFDVYGGVQYATVSGGLRSGFLEDNSFQFVTGTRVRF